MTQVDLCAAADVGRQTYRDGLAGRYAVRGDTIAKLEMALKRHRIGFGAAAGAIAPHAAYKACLVLAAFALDADPRAVLASDPKKRATQVPAWLAAARVRRVGLYIANQLLGFAQADLARASGLSRAAVHAAIKEFYDEREDDAALDAALARLERIFEG